MHESEATLLLDQAARDPYDLAGLLRDAAEALAAGARAPMQHYAGIVCKLYPESRSLGMIQRLATTTEITFGEGSLILGPSSADRLSARGHLGDASRDTALPAPPTNLVVLEVSANGPDLAFLSTEIPHLSHMVVTGRSVRDGRLRAMIYHEFGHAALRCGCRFLDEGFAVYLAQQGDPEKAFPAPRRSLNYLLETHRSQLHSLYGLLSLDASSDLYFDQCGGEESSRRLIYAQGWAVVQHLFQRFGKDRISRLYAQLSTVSPTGRVGLIEAELQVSIGQLEADALGESPSCGIGTVPGVPEIDRLRQARAQEPHNGPTLLALAQALTRLIQVTSGSTAVLRAELSEILDREGVCETSDRQDMLREVAPMASRDASRTARATERRRPVAPSPAETEPDRSPRARPATAPLVLDLTSAEVCAGRRFRMTLNGLRLFGGEAVALLGANGAGKTTLLGLLAGVLDPVRVTGTLLGHDLRKRERPVDLRRQIGVQLQRFRQIATLTVGELVGLHNAVFARPNEALLASLGITDLRSRRYGTLSEGQRRRVDIYLAAAHAPALLLLDEPTAGLDARFRNVVRSSVIAGAVADGRAVLFATHSADDLAQAGRVVILGDGRLRMDGTPEHIVQNWLAPHRGELRGRDGATLSRVVDRVRSAVADLVVWPRSPSRVVVFGGAGLQEAIEEAGRFEEIESYSFGATTHSDVISFAAGMDAFESTNNIVP